MKKVVIIGANEFQNKLILKAKECGYETHVFAWQSGDIGEKNADYFYPISIVEKELILEECKKIKPDAVTSIASDLAVITVNYVAKHLGLTCNDPKDSLKCTNKYEMRRALKQAGLKTPEFQKANNVEELKINSYPLIVKPTDRSGSRAIALVNNEEELKEAIKNATENSFEKYAIIEEVIIGQEYSCECISFDGQHNFLTITKKYTTGFPSCIETAHIQPSGLSEEKQEEVKEIIFKALDALNIKNGASHSEFKIDENGEIGIIEIGARMGGDCIGSDLVQISTGYDFVKMVLDVSLGKSPEFIKTKEPKVAFIKFIFSKEEYEYLESLIKEKPEILYYKSKIEDMDKRIVDSSSRYGFYIFELNSMEQFKEIFKENL